MFIRIEVNGVVPISLVPLTPANPRNGVCNELLILYCTPYYIKSCSFSNSACKCKVTPCDVTYCKCEQKESATPETFSKSTEHDISFKRLAPAIAQEDESLKESLLDYAVNHFGKQHTGTKKILSGRVFKRVKRKVFSAQARRKEGVPSPTRLPTCMCASPRVTRQRQDRLTGREECLRHFNR